MRKFVRAGFEAVLSITVTLAVIIGAFSAMFGMDALIALSGFYYIVWAAVVVAIHLALARHRRHLRLSISVGAGVIVMAVHLAMFLTGNIVVDINMVPVILHDFGLALIAMIVLNIVHLVILRRRRVPQLTALAAPVGSERVDDVPAPMIELPEDLLDAEPHAKSA
ncbi:MAG: hypothetical protein WED09_01170 [Homoserinimonas sp.]